MDCPRVWSYWPITTISMQCLLVEGFAAAAFGVAVQQISAKVFGVGNMVVVALNSLVATFVLIS